MLQVITTANARNNFSNLLGEVYYGGKKYLIQKLGKPFAVLLNVEEYKKLEELRESLFKEIAANRNKNENIPLKEVETDVEEAVTAVRSR
ncbi:hypothetical protein COT64_01320 [Candidatus Shapirobacteria bacterium CG09_land_8_20_14_0_10_39_12]|uniref:Antitoxin n=1 Tax=Candidatus Shapirobacteria bacterium CG09_land_8_20_14_0_10_39_12 TaxID=1974885 RepID=A0A2H0WPX0_9BACT|nr:MAG: hypothetical protein COT64_01320 [Candidatus Shapirobacteria bacterium CG09_land_8_20_14_0_10_39_12]